MSGKKAYEFYDDHAKQQDPDDLWGQVRRSTRGRPVDERQIDMIVESVVAGLALQPDDLLLDLCCGNGALTDLVFQRCRGGVGVDFSEYLISVAKRRFERATERLYEYAEVRKFVATAADPGFTKVLCYGSFAYFDDQSAADILIDVRNRFARVERFAIGNMPDRARIREFYYEGEYVEGVENDDESWIGVWRTEEEFARLAAAAGWATRFQHMPPEFFAAHYRYDAILSPVR